jgi:GH43 family beta-xylosidase
MNRFLHIIFLFCSYLVMTACDEADDSSNFGIDVSELVGKDYLSVLPATIQVGNFAGTFKLNIATNLTWSATTEDEWIKLPKTEGGKEILNIGYTANGDVTTSRKAKIIFSAKGQNNVVVDIVQSDKTFANPIAGIPDPWIVQHQGAYYTCKAHYNGINVSKSDRLTEINPTKAIWTAPKDNGTVKPWNTSHVWAPELHFIDGKWYVYYAAGRPIEESGGSYKMQRTGVLRSKTVDPLGEYEDMGMIYTGDEYVTGIVATADNTCYAIDMGVLKIESKLYAVWSGTISKETGGDQRIYIAEMSNPWTICSNRVQISKPDQSWELISGKVNEGPAFLQHDGKVFIVYSCNGSWTKDYRLAYLMLDVGDNPMDPTNWKKSPNAVFYRCDDTVDEDGVNGVGHCCFTKSPDGTEDWIVYHVKNRNYGSYETGRSTFMQRFTWNTNGTPNFGIPVGWAEPIVVPSGE